MDNSTNNETFYDLVYFGYMWEDDSSTFKQEFIELISEKFPSVVIENADDSIKGYRSGVTLRKEFELDYVLWIIADGWSDCSLTLQLAMMSNETICGLSLSDILDKTKLKYPEKFKK